MGDFRNWISMATLLLVFSILLQLVTAWLALRLIPVSGGRRAWILLALAFVTRALRHFWHFGTIYLADYHPDLTEEAIGLVVSLLMLVGVSEIAPLFHSLQNASLEKRAMLVQVEQNLARLKAVFHSMNEGLIFSDRAGNILEWNPASLALYGFDSLQKMPATLGELEAEFQVKTLDGKTVPVDQWPLHRALRGDKFNNLELLITRKDVFKDRVFSFSGNSVPGQGDIPFMALITLRDITEAKWAENAIRENEKRFRLLAESAPVGVLESDGAGALIYANPQWLTLSGYPWAQIQQTGWLKAIHPGERAVFEKNWLGTTGSWSHVFLFQKPDAQDVWVSVKVTTVVTEDSEPVRIVGVFEDISAIKRTELELNRAIEASETANRAKSDFLANMSHEIRTPMTVLMGMIELVLESPLTQTQREYLETASSAADTLLALIDDLLDFSKSEAGKLAFDKAPFDLAACLRKATGMFTEKARQKGLELSCVISPQVPVLAIGDEQRIFQVLTNLLANAVKFTDQGGIRIIVESRQSRFDPQSRGVIFTVQDSGIGIQPEKIDILFQRFTQVDSSLTRKYGGSGLGLALCKSLVEGMGGFIWVDSEVGRGSAFSFWLPLEDQEAETTAPILPSASSIKSGELCLDREKPGGTPVRVLLAEDEPVIADLVRLFLQSRGWTVCIASDGEKAIEAFQREPYDLVLMDVQMPGMDGLEATRRIREYERGKGIHVPIIALTAHALDYDRQRCMDAGMDEFFTKPIQREVLFSLVERYLARLVSSGNSP